PGFDPVNTWKVILATLVLFGAGVITGGLLVQHALQPRSARPLHSPGVSRQSAWGMRYEFLRRMGRDLDLTPEQREKIDAILKESQEKTRKALHEQFQETKAAFREVLTPEQREKFEELIKHPQRGREQRKSTSIGARPPEVGSVTNSR
ncbi:MAG: Spy/CpxP family protein refolding chaperone, partial [Limisphaerales bacterium]